MLDTTTISRTLDCGDNANIDDNCIGNMKEMTELCCGGNIKFTDAGIANMTKLWRIAFDEHCKFTYGYVDKLLSRGVQVDMTQTHDAY